MSSNKVHEGKVSAASGASPIPGSVSQEQGVLPLSSGSVGSLRTGRALEGKLIQLISEVNQLNALMGTVARAVTGFEKRIQSVEDSLQDQSKRMEGQENRLDIQSSKLEDEIRELKSQVSSSGNLGQVISQFASVTIEQRFKIVEDQNKELQNQIHKLKNWTKKLKSHNNGQEDQTDRLQDQNKGLEDEINKLKEQTYKLQDQNKGLEDQINKFKDQTNTFQDQKKGLENQDKNLRDQNNGLEGQTRKLEDLNKRLEERTRKVEEQNNELKDETKKGEDQKKKLEDQTSNPEHQNKGLEDQTRMLKDQNGKLQNLEERIKGLRSEVQELKTRNSYSGKEKTVDVVTSPRTSRTSSRDVLFVMGGFDNVVTVETLDPIVGSWVSHKIPDAPSKETWIVSVGHKVLVLERENKRFRSLDVSTREWTELQYLPQQRWFFTVAGSGDQVYVLGGVEPHGTRCDRYDARTDRWGETAPMREGRIFAASACHAGKLYCSGGRSVPGDSYLSSLEVMDPRGYRQWVSLPPMGVRRSCHCLASSGRFLWAIGGWDGETRLSDVEKYDVDGQQWSRVCPLDTPRRYFSASVIDGRVHVIGGGTAGGTRVRTVEVYYEEEDRWVSAAPLHKERSYHASCLIRSLPDSVADKMAVPMQWPPSSFSPFRAL